MAFTHKKIIEEFEQVYIWAPINNGEIVIYIYDEKIKFTEQGFFFVDNIDIEYGLLEMDNRMTLLTSQKLIAFQAIINTLSGGL